LNPKASQALAGVKEAHVVYAEPAYSERKTGNVSRKV
jgi:hypothetical protein